MEEWEALAPLTDIENRSVTLLKAATEKSSLPIKVCTVTRSSSVRTWLIETKFSADDPGPSSHPASPALRGHRLLGTPRPSTPMLGPGSSLLRSNTSLEPTHPIQTPQQFYDWFALIDRSVTHSQEAHFRAHLADVANHLDTCDRLKERVDEVEGEVERMLGEWRSVEDSGKSLKDTCEHMLNERVGSFHLICIKRADCVAGNL